MFGIELNPNPNQKKIEFEDTGVGSMVDLSWLQDNSGDFKLDYHFRPNDMRNELGAKVLGQTQRDPKNVNDASLAGLWGSDPEGSVDKINDVIVEFTRKLVAQGYSGEEITNELKKWFSIPEIKACAEQLTPIFKWDGIAGHFAVDVGVFQDCAEALKLAQKSRFASSLKYVIPNEKCAHCIHCKGGCGRTATVGGSLDSVINPQNEVSEGHGKYCEKLGMKFLAGSPDDPYSGVSEKYTDGMAIGNKEEGEEIDVKKAQKKFKEAHKQGRGYVENKAAENTDYFYTLKANALDGDVRANEKILSVEPLEIPRINGEIPSSVNLKEVDMTPAETPGFDNKLEFVVDMKRNPDEERQAFKVVIEDPEQRFKVEEKKKNDGELKITFI